MSIDDYEQQYKPEFGLRPLGYSRRDVEVTFAEGRMALRQLRAEAKVLRARVDALEAELETSRRELDEARAREHEVERLTLAASQRAAELEDEARARAREIVQAADDSAALTRGEATLRAEEISRQIDELLRVREELFASARSAAHALDDAVTRIERGQFDAPPTRSEQAAASAVHASEDAKGQLFESHVEVDAGPFRDFAELSAFERSLGRLPKVQDVYIRRFADERATIELTLVEPAQLIDGLADILPHSVSVTAATARSLKLEIGYSAELR